MLRIFKSDFINQIRPNAEAGFEDGMKTISENARNAAYFEKMADALLMYASHTESDFKISCLNNAQQLQGGGGVPPQLNNERGIVHSGRNPPEAEEKALKPRFGGVPPPACLWSRKICRSTGKVFFPTPTQAGEMPSG